MPLTPVWPPTPPYPSHLAWAPYSGSITHLLTSYLSSSCCGKPRGPIFISIPFMATTLTHDSPPPAGPSDAAHSRQPATCSYLTHQSTTPASLPLGSSQVPHHTLGGLHLSPLPQLAASFNSAAIPTRPAATRHGLLPRPLHLQHLPPHCSRQPRVPDSGASHSLHSTLSRHHACLPPAPPHWLVLSVSKTVPSHTPPS